MRRQHTDNESIQYSISGQQAERQPSVGKLTWRSRIPRVAEPNLVASSPRSAISCSTKAEEDSESAAPITMASSTVRMAASRGEAWNTLTRIWVPMPLPTGRAKSVKAAVLSAMDTVPKPKAYFAKACMPQRQSMTATCELGFGSLRVSEGFWVWRDGDGQEAHLEAVQR